MVAIRILNMKGGNGEESYANNSSLQRKALTIAKPIIEEEIKYLYSRLVFPKTLCISDMGCSSGSNTLFAVSQIIEAAHDQNIRSRSLGPDSQEFLIHLIDLPTNDFNTIFEYIPQFQEDIRSRVGPACFITGVPGSFYHRLFPSQTMHFVHSSYSLHWLSQVPEEATDNKGNIYLSTTSPPNVAKAYLKQFNKDFSSFLRCRAIELVDGGCMVLTFLGRRLEDSGAWESQGVCGALSMTLNDMVIKGLIDEEKVNSFNTPVYFPSESELKLLVDEEGSFTINRVGLADVHWNVDDNGLSSPDLAKIAGLNVAKSLRAVWEPLLASHFGQDVVDEVFSRFAEILSDCMLKKRTMYLNVTISLRKKV